MAGPTRPPRPPSIANARASLASGEASPESVLDQCLARIDASEGTVRAWRTLDRQGASDQARQLDPETRAALPLWGIPVGIKDVIDVAGLPTTAASAVLAGTGPAATDAAAVARLRAAGAVVLGKTNTQEFAYGAVSPPTTNPRDERRIPGGSSGGSAAALAAGHCLGALGTDTAGSIRIPAALCGVVGLKPRPGIVPMDGIIPLAPSFDVVGPMAGDVAGVAALWAALTGRPAPPAAKRAEEVRTVRVTATPFGVLPEMEADVEAAYLDAIAVCARLTNAPPRAAVPAFADFDVPRRTVLMWEALEVHRARGWWPGCAEAYTEETRSYLEWAETNLTAESVETARADCAKLAGALASATARSILLAPTVPCQAPLIAEAATRDPSQPRRPIVAKLTRIPGPVNVAGLAALSVPCGNTTGGLPVGLMMIGQDEDMLLRLGAAFEQAIGWEPAALLPHDLDD